LDYNDVPNFVELGDDWYQAAMDVFKEHGYSLGDEFLYNPKVSYLEMPTSNCYAPFKRNHDTIGYRKMSDGIDGLFLASVYSPKYTDPKDHPMDHLHSVICDFDLNIVFDPNKEYEKVINYPYSKLIGCNGIRGIDTIRRVK
jgi:hypothetical protein